MNSFLYLQTVYYHPTVLERVNDGCEAVVGKTIHKKGRPIH